MPGIILAGEGDKAMHTYREPKYNDDYEEIDGGFIIRAISAVIFIMKCLRDDLRDFVSITYSAIEI